MKKIEIKNRWTGKILFEYKKEDATIKKALGNAIESGADLRGADLRGASLRGANLIDADLIDADLIGADLRGADLIDANLNFEYFKNDMWAKMLQQQSEIIGLKQAIINGEIDGSVYEGDCCCFVGTIAKTKGVNYKELNITPDSRSPIEQWFMQFKKGDNPENNKSMNLTLDWIHEFEQLVAPLNRNKK
jgi:hypothetical protein